MSTTKGAKVLKTSKTSVNASNILSFIQWHKGEVDRYVRLKAYYEGNQDILHRTVRIDSNANNKVLANYCSLITNTLTSYFIAKPLEYKTENEETKGKLFALGRLNQDENHNFEMAKRASIFGHSFEILYFDDNANVRYERTSPMDTFMLYDIDTNGEKAFGAIRYTEEKDPISEKTIVHAQYYDKQNVFSMTFEGGVLRGDVTSELHRFNGIPVLEVKNNDERIGDFEVVLELQDAYNLLMSDRTNNIENSVNALLVLKNYSIADTEEAKKIVKILKERGVLAMDEHGDAEFLSQNIDSNSSKDLAIDISNEIHKIACCPNMSDANFAGNSSGVAIKYKMFGTDQVVAMKERKFKTAVYRRLQLISDSPSVANLDLSDVDMMFFRNTPDNEVEKIEAYVKLKDIVSDKTLIELLSFLGINDVEAELKRLSEQRKSVVVSA